MRFILLRRRKYSQGGKRGEIRDLEFRDFQPGFFQLGSRWAITEEPSQKLDPALNLGSLGEFGVLGGPKLLLPLPLGGGRALGVFWELRVGKAGIQLLGMGSSAPPGF